MGAGPGPRKGALGLKGLTAEGIILWVRAPQKVRRRSNLLFLANPGQWGSNGSGSGTSVLVVPVAGFGNPRRQAAIRIAVSCRVFHSMVCFLPNP